MTEGRVFGIEGYALNSLRQR